MWRCKDVFERMLHSCYIEHEHQEAIFEGSFCGGWAHLNDLIYTSISETAR
jgi:hypothetical protein